MIYRLQLKANEQQVQESNLNMHGENARKDNGFGHTSLEVYTLSHRTIWKVFVSFWGNSVARTDARGNHGNPEECNTGVSCDSGLVPVCCSGMLAPSLPAAQRVKAKPCGSEGTCQVLDRGAKGTESVQVQKQSSPPSLGGRGRARSRSVAMDRAASLPTLRLPAVRSDARPQTAVARLFLGACPPGGPCRASVVMVFLAVAFCSRFFCFSRVFWCVSSGTWIDLLAHVLDVGAHQGNQSDSLGRQVCRAATGATGKAEQGKIQSRSRGGSMCDWNASPQVAW